MKKSLILLLSLFLGLGYIHGKESCEDEYAEAFKERYTNIFHNRERNLDENLILITELIVEGLEKGVCEAHLATAFNIKGIVLEIIGKFSRAEKSYTIALNKRRQLGDTASIASVYNNLCILYKRQEKYEDALKYANTCLQLLGSPAKDTTILARVYISIGNIYLESGKLADAKSYLDQADELLAQNAEVDLETLTDLRYNYAIALFEENELDASLTFFDKCLGYYQEQENKDNMALVENNKGLVFLKMGDYQQAKAQLFKSREINKLLKPSAEFINDIIDKLLAHQRAGKKDLEAQLAESVITALGDPTENELMQSLENELKTKDLEASDLKLSYYRTCFWGLALLALILALALYLFNRERKIADQKRQEAELEAEENSMYAKVGKIFSRYKEKVDRVLHDESCQWAVNAKREIELFILKKDEQYLVQSKVFIDHAYNTARSLVGDNIHGSYFDNSRRYLPNLYQKQEGDTSNDFSIKDGVGVQYILTILEQAEQLGYFKVSKRLDATVNQIRPTIIKQLTVITNVLIENVIKHAECKHVRYELSIDEEGTQVQMLISDNGCGFKSQSKHKGIGLKNTRHRVENILKGNIRLTTAPEEGVTIEISVPLDHSQISHNI